MVKIKTDCLRKDKFVIHQRKAEKRPETDYKHVDGEKIKDETPKDVIEISDDELRRCFGTK